MKHALDALIRQRPETIIRRGARPDHGFPRRWIRFFFCIRLSLVAPVLIQACVSANSSPEISQTSANTTPSAQSAPTAPPLDSLRPASAANVLARSNLWSLQPIQARSLPSTNVGVPSPHPIDQWIANRFPNMNRANVRRLSPRLLARRVAFDLTGLPPDFEWVQRLEQDPSPALYQRYVDALLASPRFGEHFARLWLDVVRYSDSNGFDWDELRPNAWKFRDYVIRSFNSDKPMDQFFVEQLAGDELVSGPPVTRAEQDCLIATGYLRLGPHDNSAGAFNEQDRSRAELMFDLVETTGSAFLGLTLACCRCHDHKFDPLSQADYFRLQAFFEPVRFADDLPINLANEQETIRRHNASVEAPIELETKKRDAILASVRDRLRQARLAKLTDEERALLELPENQQSPDLKSRIEGIRRKVDPRDKEIRAELKDAEKSEVAAIENALSQLHSQKRRFENALAMTDRTETPEVTRVFFQGNHKEKRQAVEPGFPVILDPLKPRLQTPRNPQTHGRRLTLARWMVSPENPLTTRVFVNRLWQSVFGEGLVSTPNDFGFAGARPIHPELLDWMASTFSQDGWSAKRLIRLLVTSETYQSSVVPGVPIDSLPAGLLRMAPLRLGAEPLRDSLLAVSGALAFPNGGSPIWPVLPAEVLQANPAFLDDNAEKTKGWYPSPEPSQNVRSIFLVQKRTVRIPFLETFDLPENSTSCSRRTRSIVAPQAFALLNDPIATRAARFFAQTVSREAGTNRDDQIHRIFQRAFQRNPNRAELERFRRFLDRRTLVEACRVVLNLNEFAFVD